MTNLSLPPLVQKYFAAAKDNDWDTLAGCFIEGGIVVDEGHTYLGRVEIIRWREGTGSQWTYTSELTKAEPVGATGYHVVNHLEGDFPGGVADLHYQFTFKEDLIYTLTIAS